MLALRCSSFSQVQRSVCLWRKKTFTHSMSTLSMTDNIDADTVQELNLERRKTLINWYPGHIAKAESQLKEYLKLVDVVVECRDARILESTTHPSVADWIGKRPHIVVVNREDAIPSGAIDLWKKHLLYTSGRSGKKKPVFFVNSKRGTGIHTVKRAILKAGAFVNERRVRRGIQPRAIRTAIIGYPNVGKSALINRLIGRAVARSKNIPGVTRTLNWHRIGRHQGQAQGQGAKSSELELLDSPGIIPAKQVDQSTAVRLAICNDIGQASYDTQVVSGLMIDIIKETYQQYPEICPVEKLQERYGINIFDHTGEGFLYEVAQKLYKGSTQSAGDRLLGDFRKGYLGNLCLEAPPAASTEDADQESNADDDWDEGLQESKEESLKKLSGEGSVVIGKGDFEGW
uniref:G domain-containing protein n=1 Tax=Heterosigma akashiwo TaxID=2829 RepID=A0A7S4D8U7_HETAK